MKLRKNGPGKPDATLRKERKKDREVRKGEGKKGLRKSVLKFLTVGFASLRPMPAER